jgi:hypothetical protein
MVSIFKLNVSRNDKYNHEFVLSLILQYPGCICGIHILRFLLISDILMRIKYYKSFLIYFT